MDSYNELIESLRSMEPMVCSTAADAIEALQSRVAELESRLEISPLHNVDGIMARDATIKLQDERIADLQAECSELRGMAGAMDILRSEMIDSGVIDINVPPMFFSESIIPRLLRLADMEKQEPVAWLDRSTEERPGDTVWLPDDLQGMSTRGLVPLYAAPPVITQHEPVTTVEDRYNADGKSCHITDYLPAGMKLYARPVHAEPVNARLLRLIKKARITIFDGLETPCELEHPASIDDRMLVTEIDSAIADAEAQQAAPVRLTDKNIDRALSERVPGGSEVRDWFLPHDTDRGHANILTVVRAIETFVLRANGFKVEGEQ